LATVARPDQKLEAIILAAGAGARFGGGKLLATWRGRPMIEAALAHAAAAPVRGVTLVIGADPRVADVARAWVGAAAPSVPLAVVHAADHAEGMAASLRAGMASLPADTDGALVFLGDMPRIPSETAARLAAAFPGPHAAVAPTCQGRRGHPVLFGSALFPELGALTGDRGARAVLDSLGERLIAVPVDDPGILFDVDTRERLNETGASPI